MKKIAVENADKSPWDDLQRELTAKGWVVRTGHGHTAMIVATKRSVPPATRLMGTGRKGMQSGERQASAQLKGGRFPASKNWNTSLCDLHYELTKKRWSMIVGRQCDYNPGMSRIAIPYCVEYLNEKGWRVKIKEGYNKTTIVITEPQLSLIKRLRSRFRR